MKHIKCVSKDTPALAQTSGLLTNKTPGIFGMNELGDVVIWLGTLAELGKFNIMPNGVTKSGV